MFNAPSPGLLHYYRLKIFTTFLYYWGKGKTQNACVMDLHELHLGYNTQV